MAQWLMLLHLLLVSLVGVRTQAPPVPTQSTMTNQPQHPFCNSKPYPQTPKMEIFQMDVKTGFLNGYRSNQTVIVDITAKFPEVWRIHQVFIQVPETDPNVYRGRPNDYRYHKSVGHWAWNLKTGSGNANPDVGGTQPVDCGGISNYGPFGMLTSMGAHAAMQISGQDPTTGKGWTSVTAKWVPPSNWENIVHRKMITIEAYVTFERTPPTAATTSQVSFTNGYTTPQRPSRWIKKQATLLNLDYIDVHNYILHTYRPWYQSIYGPRRTSTDSPVET